MVQFAGSTKKSLFSEIQTEGPITPVGLVHRILGFQGFQVGFRGSQGFQAILWGLQVGFKGFQGRFQGVHIGFQEIFPWILRILSPISEFSDRISRITEILGRTGVLDISGRISGYLCVEFQE